MRLSWLQCNQHAMCLWMAAEGAFTATHHAELAYIALVWHCPQALPALLLQVVKPAAHSAVIVSLEQRLAVQVTCVSASDDAAWHRQLRWAKQFVKWLEKAIPLRVRTA